MPKPATTPARAIASIYRGIDGYEIPRAEEKAVNKSGGDSLYGELMPSAVTQLVKKLRLGERDVFYDLGSGSGKVVIQVAMSAPVRRCVGYELSQTRCRLARSRLREARRQGLVVARRCTFYEQDILKAPLEDATVIYTCSTAFSDRFMRRLMRRLAGLARPLTFVTLRDLDEHRSFELTDRVPLRTSWSRRSPAYVYRVSPRTP